jgi:hypothetical protein
MSLYPERTASTAGRLAPGHLTADHLTADQIDDHLIGDLAPAPAAHLAACDLCAQRVATAASPLADFHSVSTAWSERRSATLPMPLPTPQRPVWQRYTSWATASLTLAFGMAFINATHQFSLRTVTPQPVPTARSLSAAQTATPQTAAAHAIASLAALHPAAHRILSSPAPAFTETASTAPLPQPTQISADNHMLRAIDASFAPSADSPAALGLMPDAAPGSRPPASLQD